MALPSKSNLYIAELEISITANYVPVLLYEFSAISSLELLESPSSVHLFPFVSLAPSCLPSSFSTTTRPSSSLFLVSSLALSNSLFTSQESRSLSLSLLSDVNVERTYLPWKPGSYPRTDFHHHYIGRCNQAASWPPKPD